MALGAVRAFLDHGLRVPEDISVIGLDGLPVGRFYSPKLTTIRQKTAEMADLCVRTLLESLEGQPSRHLTVPFELDCYESVNPCGGAAAETN